MNPEQIPPQQPQPPAQPTPPPAPVLPSPPLSPVAPPPPAATIAKPKRGFKLALLVIVPIGLVLLMIIYAFATTSQKAAESSFVTEPVAEQATAMDSYAHDTAQKNEAANMTSSINEYIANNNGKLPANSAELQSALVDYFPATDSEYALSFKSSYSTADLPKDTYELYYFGGYTCDDNKTVRAGSSRQFTIVYASVDGTQRCMANT
jgi:type II secretory pathway pseudopilin PulG